MRAEELSVRSLDADGWSRALHPYRTPGAIRGAWELAITITPFALGWLTMIFALSLGYAWLYALLLLPTTGLLVRLFMIQHDCGHGSFLPSRSGNDWLGRALGVLTLMPYDHWRRGHAVHHATAGNLQRRGVGDVRTLTVAEYVARPRWTRFTYRLYRHPAIMFGLGPVFLFVLQSRLPFGFMRHGWRPWISVMTTNAAIATLAGVAISVTGLVPFLLVQVPMVLVGGAAGVWLFYVQHQFEQTYWANGSHWDRRDAALRGSSHFDLPVVLRWFTANIGVHHVHHLSSAIPYYRLPDVLRDHPDLRDCGRVTLLQSVLALRLVLWDEQSRRLISFAELRARANR